MRMNFLSSTLMVVTYMLLTAIFSACVSMVTTLYLQLVQGSSTADPRLHTTVAVIAVFDSNHINYTSRRCGTP